MYNAVKFGRVFYTDFSLDVNIRDDSLRTIRKVQSTEVLSIVIWAQSLLLSCLFWLLGSLICHYTAVFRIVLLRRQWT
jgi:hypothetical protein